MAGNLCAARCLASRVLWPSCACRPFHAPDPRRSAERVGDLSRSDTGRAAGIGVAMIVSNVLALGFTVVFARVLGASGYGDLAVLLSSFIIMMVPGSALQIAAAREVSHDIAEGNPNAGAGVRRWLDRLVRGHGRGRS